MYRSMWLSILVVFLPFPSPSNGQGNSDPMEDVQTFPGVYGKPLDLPCVSVVSGSVETTKWFRDGAEITIDPKSDFEIIAENNTLRIKKITPQSIGKKEVKEGKEIVGKVASIFNCKYGSIEKYFEIKVKPHVEPFDSTRNIIEGDPLRLECKAWGIPAPTVTWFVNETQLVPSDVSITFKTSGGQKGDTFPELANGTIRIAQLDEKDRGSYTCYASNIIYTETLVANTTVHIVIKNKYAALWPFLGICVEVAVLCAIILIYEKRRAKRIEEEERQEEAAHLNANNEGRTGAGGDEVRQRK